ncbi:unnamed protein product (macronuclear) [Paramecium tetraurelia]|uniref:Protein kinase domain-containing protein n=1 Tax=Paramecium tetraurelia TaxID=5888 RepID=A0CNM1_PARTE|nr:uncharacterized protein GSPATT00008830001 [Paramecium tetraurelia]CAK72388.1 unnamed protein product [Paramecium tetraurelia]|eukprot:XP_001439785.1 hypothetical protein (macronuclear) [Paramecium tetraurelia strain d4-2]
MTQKTIDQYVFNTKDVLGQGSFGVVFKATNKITGREVALKMISKDKMLKDQNAINGVKSEIWIMQKLNNKNIVQLIDVLETSNNIYIIQEICESGDLAKYLKQHQFVNEQQALKIMTEILQGFIELIKFGIIHRDLKPANILIHQNTYKIADFGFAKIVDNFAQQLFYSQVGTPLYMSPQILKNEKYSTKCDVWSFGFLFYEIIYGRTPWVASSIPQLVKNINTQPLQFYDSINQVSDNVKDLISKCLAIQEKDRYSWYDIFAHPLFSAQFSQTPNLQQICEQKELYIANRLREILGAKQINNNQIIEELQQNSDDIILQDKLKELLIDIDADLEDYAIQYIFNSIDEDQNGQITCQEFCNWMIKHEIINDFQVRSTSNTISGPYQIQQQEVQDKKDTKTIIYNLISAIQQQNENLVELFYKFVKGQENMSSDDFADLLLYYDDSLSDDEIFSTFQVFDLDEKNEITLQQFKYILEQDIDDY